MSLYSRLLKLARAATPGAWRRLPPPYHDTRDPRSAERSTIILEPRSENDVARDVARVDAAYIEAIQPRVLMLILDELSALRRAVQYYADPEQYSQHDGWNDCRAAIMSDTGHIAQSALKRIDVMFGSETGEDND